MTDPTDRLRLVTGEEAWARAHVFPKPTRTRPGSCAVLLIFALLLALLAGALAARGMVDARASIEIGPEGLE